MGKRLPISGYVVYVFQEVQDGHDEFAKAYDNLDQALAYINTVTVKAYGASYTFRLFELGKEIPLTQESVETPQPPTVEKRYKVKS